MLAIIHVSSLFTAKHKFKCISIISSSSSSSLFHYGTKHLPLTTSKMNNKNQVQPSLYNYNEVSKNSTDGFSMYFFHVFENLAIVAPSMTL
jgi:hypothetical protein